MLKHYIKIVFRNFITQRPYSFLNLAGLSIGLTVAFIALLYVTEETGWDTFNKNYENTYRLIQNESHGKKDFSSITNPFVVKTLNERIPEITNSVSYKGGGIKVNNIVETENIYYADPSIVDVFTFNLINGNFETFNTDLKTVIISENFAIKHFKNLDVVGKELSIGYEGITIGNQKDDEKTAITPQFVIGAVFKNFPKKSIFTPDLVVPNLNDQNYEQFLTPNLIGGKAYQSYFVLNTSELSIVQEKIDQVIADIVPKSFEEGYELQPLEDIHLHSSHINSNSQKGAIKKVLLYGGIGSLILVISVINFMLLYRVVSQKRIKEFVVRKINGLQSTELLCYFLFECFVISIISTGISLVLLHQLIPVFNEFTTSNLTLSIFENLNFLGYVFIIILIVSILISLYTFNHIRNKSIVNSLQKPLQISSYWVSNRTNLIQLGIVCFMIAVSLSNYKQLDFILNSDKGYEDENIFNIQIWRWSDPKAFKEELLKTPEIIDVSNGNFLPQYGGSSGGTLYLKSDISIKEQMEIYRVADNYIPFYNIKLKAGRNFSKNLVTDETETVIINESAAKALGLTNAIGVQTNNGEIIGVVEDFKFESLRKTTRPVFIQNRSFRNRNILVKYKEGSKKQVAHIINEQLKKHNVFLNPNTEDYKTFDANQKFVAFDPDFREKLIGKMYGEEETLQKAIFAFTSIAIIVAILGLIGMTLYKTEQKTKEIGIRKVNGATITEIMLMLNKDFIKWVLIAFVIACPIAYYAMSKWLENFAYKTSLSWWVFALAGIFTLVIALLTVSWQTYRAASRNPVESLRDE